MSIESPITQMAKGAKKAEKPKKPEKTQEELRQALLERMETLRLSTLERIDIYEDKLEKGEFDDQAGEAEGSGEKRKLQLQAELTRADQRIDKMKQLLDSGEELPQEPLLDPESLKIQNQDFLKKEWFGTDSTTEQTPTLIKPADQDFITLKDDIDQDKYGEYTLNPDTQNLDWETLKDKIFIPDLSALEGEPLHEVAKYLIDNYSGQYKILGLEYWKWLIENPNKSPAKLKDGKYYFNFGSLVRNSDGHWYVPYACWDGSDWIRSASWLDFDWTADDRVVLLEI